MPELVFLGFLLVFGLGGWQIAALFNRHSVEMEASRTPLGLISTHDTSVALEKATQYYRVAQHAVALLDRLVLDDYTRVVIQPDTQEEIRLVSKQFHNL